MSVEDAPNRSQAGAGDEGQHSPGIGVRVQRRHRFCRRGGRGRECSGDKNMSLSNRKRLADRGLACQGEPHGQTGDGACRAKGPV